MKSPASLSVGFTSLDLHNHFSQTPHCPPVQIVGQARKAWGIPACLKYLSSHSCGLYLGPPGWGGVGAQGSRAVEEKLGKSACWPGETAHKHSTAVKGQVKPSFQQGAVAPEGEGLGWRLAGMPAPTHPSGKDRQFGSLPTQRSESRTKDAEREKAERQG